MLLELLRYLEVENEDDMGDKMEKKNGRVSKEKNERNELTCFLRNFIMLPSSKISEERSDICETNLS